MMWFRYNYVMLLFGFTRDFNHKLVIEQGRICKYCLYLGIHLIEEEHHILLICPLFNDIRQIYIAKHFCPLFNDIRQRYIALLKHFRHFWPSDISFVNMMSNNSEITIRDLALFIYHMFNVHANFNSTL